MVGIIIKTYRKNKSLFNTLASIGRYCDLPYRLYVMDDGPMSEDKLQLFRKLQQDGHFVELSEKHWSVTAARNYLVSKLQDEQWVLRIDDDFEFTQGTSLKKLSILAKSQADIGAVSQIEYYKGSSRGLSDGDLSFGQGYLVHHKNDLVKVNIPVVAWDFSETEGIRWAYCDHARNFLFMKREMLATVKWDENLFFEGEHIDFMLSIRKHNWKLIFTPDSAHIHRDDLSAQDKKESSPGHGVKRVSQKKKSLAYLSAKWNFRKITSYYPYIRRPYKMIVEILGLKPSVKRLRQKTQIK